MRVILSLVLLATASVAFAQEMPKPGPEHAWLKKRDGAWTATMDMGGQKSDHTCTFKMELGGFWLNSTMEGEMFGAKFTGKNLEGYDPATKKYSSLWVDSMSAGAVIMYGTYDADKKTQTMTGEGPGMDGKPAKYKSVTVYKDNDTMTMTMFIGGDQPAFTVTYKRKK
jgi:hypothetical protein